MYVTAFDTTFVANLTHFVCLDGKIQRRIGGQQVQVEQWTDIETQHNRLPMLSDLHSRHRGLRGRLSLRLVQRRPQETAHCLGL